MPNNPYKKDPLETNTPAIMEKKEPDDVIEGAKIIQQFYNPHTYVADSGKVYEKETKELLYQHTLYHCDWNYIMPVVTKIKNMQHDPNEMFMGTTLDRKRAFERVTDLPIWTPIKLLHERVVEFIKWYNEQSK